MPIQLFSAVRSRSRIGLVDEAPTPDIGAAMPGYELYRCDDASVVELGRLIPTTAVVFRQTHKRPRQIAEQLKRLAPALLAAATVLPRLRSPQAFPVRTPVVVLSK